MWFLSGLSSRASNSHRYCGNVPWSGHGNWNTSPSVTDSINIRRGAGFYSSMAEKISGEKLMQESQDTEYHKWMYNSESIRRQTSSTIQQPYFGAQLSKRRGEANESISFNVEKCNKAKRTVDDLDLTLSLCTKLKGKEVKRSLSWDVEDVGSNLHLSLSSTSTKECNSINLSMPSKYPKKTSTLDLTM